MALQTSNGHVTQTRKFRGNSKECNQFYPGEKKENSNVGPVPVPTPHKSIHVLESIDLCSKFMLKTEFKKRKSTFMHKDTNKYMRPKSNIKKSRCMVYLKIKVKDKMFSIHSNMIQKSKTSINMI